MANPHDTPGMRQYHRFKRQHPDCVLFFRLGDFYELFYDDAKLGARTLGLTLTQRTEGIPMAGVPHHQMETYLRRMLQAGYRVAICEQMEDPSEAKGVVQREITQLVTPGTVTEDSLLDEATENPLAAIQPISEEEAAVAFAELSTGSFGVARLRTDQLPQELGRIRPRELLFPERPGESPPDPVATVATAVGCATTGRPSWQFRHREAAETLHRQFDVTTLTGYGLEQDDPLIGPAGAVVSYLLETQRADHGQIPHLRPPRHYKPADHMVIDPVSLRSLEVERTTRTGETEGSLLGTLQDCRTPMGKRTLRHWLCYPLRDRPTIEKRQDVVEAITDDPAFSEQLLAQLDRVQDVQRIASRVGMRRCTPRDLVALGQSVHRIRDLTSLLADRPAAEGHHEQLQDVLDAVEQLGATLAAACVDTPPPHLREGGLIRDGYDASLDEYRTLQRDSSQWLADYQKKLIDSTGITSLKVGYNRVFGYYIEVTHAHASKVPETFTRKQTLKQAERYITPELKDFENKVLGAAQKAIAREQDLFQHLVDEAANHLPELHAFSQVVAELDVLACFARRAVRHRYVRPRIKDTPVLRIEEGRHPVLDEVLTDAFVPNDIGLGSEEAPATDEAVASAASGDGGSAGEASAAAASADAGDGATDASGLTLALITGPNMSGKSTYIRQGALLTLLAHTGSFVPATSATIGVTDRIFTRIGASDELHAGQSTFMVEMTETANICHYATDRSLVVLDEIGRGTSTLDGLALAWSVAEYLAARRCRTLFASHYHELTQLAERFDNVRNLNVAVREWADQVVFLHRIQPGGTDRSYGIHVAKIAGLPKPVVDRARELMGQLEVNTSKLRSDRDGDEKKASRREEQLPLFTEYVEHPAVSKLREGDLDSLSPMHAFDPLRRVKEELEQG